MTKVSNNQPGAQHPPKAADPLAAASKEEKVKGAFAHLDANHDGKLAKDELGADGEALLAGAGGKPVDWKAFKEAELAPPSFAQLDQDHDGKLNGKEARGLDRNHAGTVDQQAFLQARKADAWQVQQAYRQGELAKLDADHDGQVSAAEAGKLASADKDGDGVVSQQEYNQARNEAWQAQVDQQRQARFQQLDQDHDGQLSGKEARGLDGADKDGDGKLDQQEYDAARQQEARKRREEALLKGDKASQDAGEAPKAASADLKRWWDLATKAGQRYHVDPKLIMAVMTIESGGNPRAVSSCGAQGLMQLMPGTAAGLGVKDAFDPAQNVDGGAHYLAEMIKQFGLEGGLRAYNGGPGGVDNPATAAYAQKVLAAYHKYGGHA